jgi:hypothetical protein
MEQALALKHLGGGMRTLMSTIGGHHFETAEDLERIRFSFRGCRKFNTLIISYNQGNDTYSMVFWRAGKRAPRWHPSPWQTTNVGGQSNVHAEELAPTFERATGLSLSLQGGRHAVCLDPCRRDMLMTKTECPRCGLVWAEALASDIGRGLFRTCHLCTAWLNAKAKGDTTHEHP